MTEKDDELAADLNARKPVVGNLKEIILYMHCRQCIEENARSDLEIGWTKKGLQVWCRRHDGNIVNIDFEGQKHPANTSRAQQ